MNKIISRSEAMQKNLKTYFTGKMCKHGHISQRDVASRRCVECKNQEKRNYRTRNKDAITKYNKEYYKKNRSAVLNRTRKYKKENPGLLKKYRTENKDYFRNYEKTRYESDPAFKSARICRVMLRRVVNSTSLSKNSRTYKILRYNNNDLMEYIESKFLPGMSWDNYGEWHIDHKYPVSRYIEDGVNDPSVINRLENLLPMWAEDNLAKSDRSLEEYLDENPEKMELYGKFLGSNR